MSTLCDKALSSLVSLVETEKSFATETIEICLDPLFDLWCVSSWQRYSGWHICLLRQAMASFARWSKNWCALSAWRCLLCWELIFFAQVECPNFAGTLWNILPRRPLVKIPANQRSSSEIRAVFCLWDCGAAAPASSKVLTHIKAVWLCSWCKRHTGYPWQSQAVHLHWRHVTLAEFNPVTIAETETASGFWARSHCFGGSPWETPEPDVPDVPIGIFTKRSAKHGETPRPIGAVAEVSLDVFVPQSPVSCAQKSLQLTVLKLSKMKQDETR